MTLFDICMYVLLVTTTVLYVAWTAWFIRIMWHDRKDKP